MSKMIAYCGLTCSECPAYQATQTGDPAALEAVAARWRVEYHAAGITVKDVICDGCVVEGRHCAHWSECDIRACGQARGVANCAHCADYATCPKLVRFFGFVASAKATLDGVRAGLG